MQARLANNTDLADKLNCLYTLSYEYGLIDPQRGIRYGKECLRLARDAGNLHFQINGYNGIANAFETLGNYDSALRYHSSSYEVALKTRIPVKIGLTMFNVAMCRKELGQYRNALDGFLRAYRIFEKFASYNPRIHYYLSEMYMKTGQWKEAMRHARLGYAKCMQFGQEYVAYNMLVNEARCHVNSGKIDSAQRILDVAIAGLRKHTDRISLAAGIHAQGELNLQISAFRQAAACFQEELDIHGALNNAQGIYLSRVYLAYSLARLSPPDHGTVRTTLRQSERDAERILANAEVLSEGIGRAAEAWELIGEWREALSNYHSYEMLRDSLLSIEKMWQLNELQTRYESEKKERAIAGLTLNNQLQTAENQQLRLRNLLLLLGGLMLLLAGLLLYSRYQRRIIFLRMEQQKAVRESEEKERIRLAKDIHDDLGSGLSKINFLSELLLRDNGLPLKQAGHVHHIAETASGLVVNMRDLIWALNPANTVMGGLIARIREYASDYLDECHIRLTAHLPETSDNRPITKESHRQILMVVKESLNNVVKHSRTEQVEIQVRIEPAQFFMSISDKGLGFDPSGGQGHGLGNMKTRIRSIGGALEIHSEPGKGTTITATIPLQAMMPANTTKVVTTGNQAF